MPELLPILPSTAPRGLSSPETLLGAHSPEQEREAFLPPSEIEALQAQDLIARTMEEFGSGLVLVTSFQAEGLVILDMAWRLDPQIRVVTLDTGRLPEETFVAMEKVRERYGIDIEILLPQASRVEALVSQRGPNLFHLSPEDRLECCHIRKVEPLRQALRSADAWATGLRRDQAPSRAKTPKMAFDAEHDAWKIAPLADWSWQQVLSYSRQHRVPRHPLYAKGYLSIGCAPCTRPLRPGEDPRAGRWWWEQGPKECGLHLSSSNPAESPTSISPRSVPSE